MLDVYIAYRIEKFLPNAWQVCRPGQRTDPNTVAVNRGRKTFPCNSAVSKSVKEEVAKSWASAMYDVDEWCRIEGMGNALFPVTVAEELKRHIPTLIFYKKRQKS